MKRILSSWMVKGMNGVNQENLSIHKGLIVAIIAIAIFTRVGTLLFSLPLNFAPITAIALFSGAYFGGAALGYILPLLSVWLSDHIVNFFYYGSFHPAYPGWYWQYIAYAFIALGGMTLQNRVSPFRVICLSLSSSMLFFILSNFGVWVSTGMYSHTFAGFVSCYVMAIPFFGATVLGDLFYAALMFGSCELVLRNEYSAARALVRISR